MDLKDILAYSDKLKELNIVDHYCLSHIDDNLLNITPDQYKDKLLQSLNKFLVDVRAAVVLDSNKALTLEALESLIEYNLSVKDNLSTIFAAGITSFIDLDKLPKGYSLQDEGLIVSSTGKLIFDEFITMAYARSSFYIYMDILEHIADVTKLALIDIKNLVTHGKTKNENILQLNQANKLTAFEVALRHKFLVDAKIETYIVPKQVGEKYKHLASAKNIEMHYGKLDSKTKSRIAKLKELENIFRAIEDYPEAQKAVKNCIDALS